MIYLKCPSCGTVIGNRQTMYEDGLSKIMDNKNTNNKENNRRQFRRRQSDQLRIHKECCRRKSLQIPLPKNGKKAARDSSTP